MLKVSRRRLLIPQIVQLATIWLLVAVLLALGWKHVLTRLTESRAQKTEYVEQYLSNLVHLMQENAERTFSHVDQQLKWVRDQHQEHGGSIDLTGLSAKGWFDPAMVLKVSLINAQGVLLQSSWPHEPQMDLSDREHFQIHAKNQHDTLLISHPIQLRADGRWAIPVSRPILGTSGRFEGLVVALVDPMYFVHFYDAIDMGPGGEATMFDVAGWRMVERTQSTHEFSGHLGSRVMLTWVAGGKTSGSLSDTTKTDGVLRFYHFRKLPSFPLFVALGFSAHDMFVNEDTERISRLRLTGMVSGLILLFTALASWYVVQHARAQEAMRVASIAFESAQGMFITNAKGCILRVNRGFTRVTGYASSEAIGQMPRMLKSGRHDRAFYKVVFETVVAKGSWQGEIWNRRKSGEIYPEWLNITAVDDVQGHLTHYVATFSDLSQRKADEARITQLAFYDPLTALPNRRLLTDRISHALVDCQHHHSLGAVLFVDMDRFKNINDTLGHQEGDLLLQQVAQRLGECVCEGDTVARFGGDDFVVVLMNLGHSDQEAAIRAELVCEKILATLSQPYVLVHSTLYSSASIGITLFKGVQDNVGDLFKRAELAMYRAKEGGRNRLQFFDTHMQAAVDERTNLENDLRLGLQTDQLVLYYQPQVDASDRLTGVEALVRWQHPTLGLISPAQFIPLAEECGLILPLGQWVLHTACQQLRVWARQPHTAHLTIAVNVSALQFAQESFVHDVLAVVHETGAMAQRLKLELTESLLVKDVEGMIAKMKELKANGVGFSLDDFGTGYSSLRYLKRLPLDQIKIDQSFVADAMTDAKDEAIVATTVALGKSLHMMVIAEGVETKAQRDFLDSHGCHHFQGYFFGRPGPVAELARFWRDETQALQTL